MTSTPPTDDLNAPLTWEASASVRVERLEYGKFCVTPDGPIEEMAGLRQLGRTPGFPAEVARLCDPTEMGLSSSAVEPLPPGCPLHGTVLRPVFHPETGHVPVLYRVRTRPEDGEGGVRRHYTMARYLTAPGAELSPLALLDVMDSEPLRGMTQDEMARMAPASVRELPPPAAEPDIRAFVGGGVVYLLSGIPLGLAEAAPERLFFKWVTALWYALPPQLRPLLSAGWGVGGSLSGSLAVTYAARRASHCAVYTPQSGTVDEPARGWSDPDSIITWEGGQPVWKSFFRKRLAIGHMYAHYVFGGSPHEWPRITSLAPRPEADDLLTLLPAYDYPRLPDFENPQTVRAFRQPGLKAYDEYRLFVLRRSLGGDEVAASDEKHLVKSAVEFVFEEGRAAALTLALAAQAHESAQERGDAFVWESINGSSPAHLQLLKQAEGYVGKGFPRVRLFAAVRSGEVGGCLQALASASEVGCAERLPEGVTRALSACLDASLATDDAKTVGWHTRLLMVQAAPKAYAEWARAHAFELLLLMLKLQAPNFNYVSERLLELDPVSDARLLRSYASDGEPSPDARKVVGRLSKERAEAFAALCLRDWKAERGEVGKRRARLLPWIQLVSERGLPPGVVADEVLIGLALNPQRRLSRRDVQLLAEEIHGDRVPGPLLPRVAATSLRHWSDAEAYFRTRRAAWAKVIEHWPLETRALLAGAAGGAAPAADAQVTQAAREVMLPPDALNNLLRRWLSSQERPSYRAQLAATLWGWIARLPGGEGCHPPTALDLCRDLAHGDWRTSAPPHEREFAVTAQLVEFAGVRPALTKISSQLWKKAVRPWHLRLMLGLFPLENFKPSPAQLSALVVYGDWLSQHLAERQLHPRRAEHFQLAAQPFHALAYPLDRGMKWRDEYETGVIWAAFHGVPPDSHSDLRAALYAYEPRPNRHAEMCLKYLDSYKDDRLYKRAVVNVVNSFLLPYFQERVRPEEIEARFLETGEWLLNQAAQRRRSLAVQMEPSVLKLMASVFSRNDGKNLARMAKDYAKGRAR